MRIKKVTLNGKTGKTSIVKGFIHALNDERIVQEKAGFLFKASFEDDHLRLAVAPCMINGERSAHYKMPLEKEDKFTLIGDINARGMFTIMFKQESVEQVAADKEKYIELFRRFAAFFMENGYTGDGILEEVTVGVFEYFGLSNPPKTFAELHAL